MDTLAFMIAATHTPTGRTRGALKVLVVDDSAELRALHARHLEAPGLKVYTAGHGARLLHLLRGTVPDVVVVDVDAPEMSGLSFCRQLRDHEPTRHVPVVAVTGDTALHGAAAIQSGCDVVLRKPCSQDLLLAAVRLLLERPRAAGFGGDTLRAACA